MINLRKVFQGFFMNIFFPGFMIVHLYDQYLKYRPVDSMK